LDRARKAKKQTKKKKKRTRGIKIDLNHKIIDYSELIDKSTEEFVGREWLLREVDDFLKSNNHRNFLIMGEPGCGKTSFMAELTTRHPDFPYHFVGKGTQIYLNESLAWCDPTRFAESVGYQLVRYYGDWIMNWEDFGIEVDINVKNLQDLHVGAHVGEFTATAQIGDRAKLSVREELERCDRAAMTVGVYVENLSLDYVQKVRQLLTTPLRNIAEKYPDRQLAVILDGVDEAEIYSGADDRTIIKMLPDGGLPPNVRFLLTSEPGEHLDEAFLHHSMILWLSEDEKGNTDPRTIEDAKVYIRSLAKEPSVRRMLTEHGIPTRTFVKKVVEASKGNFLYLHYYAQGVREGRKRLLNMDAFPRGLNGIYGYFLGRIKERVKKEAKDEFLIWWERYQQVLGALAVAREPLTQEQIAAFSGVTKQRAGTIIKSVLQFLDETNELQDGGNREVVKRYAVYHKTFGKYLVSEDNRDYIDGQEANERIVKHYMQRMGSWKEAYAMNYLVSHMIDAKSWDELERLLTNIEYLEKKQSPEEQYRLQNDIIELLRNQEISTDRLVNILEGILNVILEKLEVSNEKADWLDIFSYWINNFGLIVSEERKTALKRTASKFDYACGIVSRELALKYEEEGEHDFALRYAELCTWVYQRAEDHQKCAEACEFAEKMCLKEGMEEAYGILGRAEFIRMRARALTRLSRIETDKNIKEEYEVQAHEAYQELNEVLKLDKQIVWEPEEQEWRQLEEDVGEVLTPPSANRKTSKVQVVSNAHDSISAIHIIQIFENLGAAVKWTHTTEFLPEHLALENTKLTILIGGPKSPGISSVAEKFYEADKDGFLELYSAKGMVAKVLKMEEKTEKGKTLCCMVGGPSKVNTLMAAYNLSQDQEVISWVKSWL
jgi:hypothetical protein